MLNGVNVKLPESCLKAEDCEVSKAISIFREGTQEPENCKPLNTHLCSVQTVRKANKGHACLS